MLALVKELFSLLTPEQRKRFYILQVMVIIMAFTEIAGVASIGPFMALVGDISILEGDNKLAMLYRTSELTHPYDFVFLAGATVLIILTISSLFSILTLWRLILFGNRIGVEISDRLFKHYMHKTWLFHASGSSALLRSRITLDAHRVTVLIIQPLMLMNAKIVLAIFISCAIFLFNPKVALIGLIIFGTAYLVLYKLVRERLTKYGTLVSQLNAGRFTLMSEGFGGIKDVLLLNRQHNFINSFITKGEQLALSQGNTQALAQTPRYFMELLAFGSIIFLVLFLVKSYEGDLGVILPSLAIYALAGFKLLPAFQQIYSNLTLIRSAIPSYEAIRNDLKDSLEEPYEIKETGNELKKLTIRQNISLNNVTFTYPNKDTPALNSLNINIPVNSVVGIVGSTGSGKSTVIDLILGLIQPDCGVLSIDGEPLTSEKLRSWQNTLGLVPQSIYLSNSTILENIAFGIPVEKIDVAQAKLAIKHAHLDELVSDLPEGYNTIVGERGVQLSGGQRQRIGIARALYNNADVLVLDEATSALDGITEKIIMDAIHDFSGHKTIIMIAHRFTTVQKCDIIYMMDKGKVIDQGTYDELLERNPTFKKMATHT